jgi:hypothetical protein
VLVTDVFEEDDASIFRVYPEEGGIMFLQNFWYPYTTLHGVTTQISKCEYKRDAG